MDLPFRLILVRALWPDQDMMELVCGISLLCKGSEVRCCGAERGLDQPETAATFFSGMFSGMVFNP